ncbi:Uncharacterised protein [Salmonella enterica subsp. enterica serovar Bovismorbificans]|uniref:Uncharacterized protein n=1 Tax=Salmonella enterica subsp. enterica serovar Bovismorbificans TaxID=58097 RepID=A0A655C5W4_SALET|nr:Uncharacterised protein [Salmonella enterica subsp. enterica serovar Bovismorbificans]CNT97879.1 Uncharacterised protein [Salmonella enterica subsp. enterica serovar Bovismorbificans]CNV31892.1 Uncharacterised protein [Salmonella enterica subsp. enterica serovar Bovismorbificans]CPR57493.1 Uncharacterised protein [Salmonella enterica subsp. enterica serovar Bovismorbificans]CPR77996.1 Uncharacterised protein [Salmonella enterica subsp. enterica serovar Bovismorbificans]
MADMFKQQLIKGIHIIILRCGHLFQYIRMAANGALTKDHHATGQDIRAFHGDRDRRALVSTRQEVALAQHNAFTPSDIHRVDNGLLAAVGAVVLHDSRQYRRFFTQHNAIGD